MKWFLYAISLIWIAFGSCAILYTDETRKIMKTLDEKIDRKILSVLPFIAGILFLFSASAIRNPWFIRFIGFIAVIKGVFIFLNPKNIHDDLMDWYLNSLSDQTHRLFGIITL
ncbi:MAG: hypothetical protein KKH68_03430, partial [Proteobacteria bacterium]|nr:hypothetical protein [Pseudomonadota bacterium]